MINSTSAGSAEKIHEAYTSTQKSCVPKNRKPLWASIMMTGSTCIMILFAMPAIIQSASVLILFMTFSLMVLLCFLIVLPFHPNIGFMMVGICLMILALHVQSSSTAEVGLSCMMIATINVVINKLFKIEPRLIKKSITQIVVDKVANLRWVKSPKKNAVEALLAWAMLVIAVYFRSNIVIQIIEAAMYFPVMWSGIWLTGLASAVVIWVSVKFLRPAIRRDMPSAMLASFERILKKMGMIVLAMMLAAFGTGAIDTTLTPLCNAATRSQIILLVMSIASCVGVIIFAIILQSVKGTLYLEWNQESQDFSRRRAWRAIKQAFMRIPWWIHLCMACASGLVIDSILLPSLTLGIFAVMIMPFAAIGIIWTSY